MWKYQLDIIQQKRQHNWHWKRLREALKRRLTVSTTAWNCVNSATTIWWKSSCLTFWVSNMLQFETTLNGRKRIQRNIRTSWPRGAHLHFWKSGNWAWMVWTVVVMVATAACAWVTVLIWPLQSWIAVVELWKYVATIWTVVVCVMELDCLTASCLSSWELLDKRVSLCTKIGILRRYGVMDYNQPHS